MRTMLLGVVSMVCWAMPVSAQARGEPIEIPLRMEEGRLIVTVDGPSGAEYDFVLGLGMHLVTESAVERMGSEANSLSIGGVPVEAEQAQTVPDSYLERGSHGPDGVLGGMTLNGFDVLIDVPNERLVLKPVGRSVRWMRWRAGPRGEPAILSARVSWEPQNE